MERAGRGFNQQHKHLPGNHEVMSSLVPQKKGGERAKFYLPSTQHITYTALPPLPWGRGQTGKQQQQHYSPVWQTVLVTPAGHSHASRELLGALDCKQQVWRQGCRPLFGLPGGVCS